MYELEEELFESLEDETPELVEDALAIPSLVDQLERVQNPEEEDPIKFVILQANRGGLTILIAFQKKYVYINQDYTRKEKRYYYIVFDLDYKEPHHELLVIIRVDFYDGGKLGCVEHLYTHRRDNGVLEQIKIKEPLLT